MHYVMSDIHGQYNRFLKMLEKIDFSKDDYLYVVGDAIDRGPDGGFTLLEILTHPNMELLLGNHELMMMAAQYDDLAYARWVKNGANTTMNQLLDIDVNGNDIVGLLRKSKLAIPNLQIDDKTYYLVHAYPNTQNIKKDIYIGDVNPTELENMVWSRQYARDIIDDLCLAMYPDVTFIIGHTPLPHCTYCKYDNKGLPLISSTANQRIINIDCGCASNLRLGCMRLEDGKTFYI